jgi:hypothetical protein
VSASVPSISNSRASPEFFIEPSPVRLPIHRV